MTPGTRLPHATYVDHLRADAGRLLEVATELDAPVPSCPGWRVRDLVGHTRSVFQHKTLMLRAGGRVPWPPEPTDRPLDEDYRSWADAIVAELAARDPADHAWTWWATEQTAGFWARRMAHEALVHRVDAELSADLPSTVDPALGRDGTDEALTRFLAWPGHAWPAVAALPASVLVALEDGPGWLVALDPDGVRVEPVEDDGAAAAGADAALRGDGPALDLWLWGRGDLDPLHVEGSAAVVALLSDRMVTATQ